MKLVPSAEAESPTAPAPPPPSRLNDRLLLIAALAIFACGALIRLFTEAGFQGFGFDEAIYRRYVLTLDQRGFGAYPALCEGYLVKQHDPAAKAELPPTRFLYVFTTWAAKRLYFGDAPPATAATPDAKNNDPVLVSLKRVACWFSILSVGLVGLATWRMLGPPVGLGAMALMAVSPLSIHMSAHAFVDGFFAFWATLCVWLLWENLQRPNERVRLTALGLALALLVIAKENAAFVYVALCALAAVSRWAKFGAVTRPLVLVGIAGPLAGLTVLVTLAGGADIFADIYRTFVVKAQALPVVIATQDGPWHRYLFELLLVDPLVLLLALSAVFTLPAQRPAALYLLGFFAVSYASMCNVRYGMNLRFATIWALPLSAFAAAQLIALATHAGRRALITGIVLFVAVCAYDLRQYRIFFIDAGIYELTPMSLLRAVQIFKEPPRK